MTLSEAGPSHTDVPAPSRPGGGPGGTVVFLGAGASAAFGLPVTSEILPRIIEHLDSDSEPWPLFPGNDRCERLKKLKSLRDALGVLHPGMDSATPLDTHELPSITNVLSFLDHLILHAHPAGLRFGVEKLVEARRLLERAIMEVLIDVDLTSLAEKMDRDSLSSEESQLLTLPERRMTSDQRALLEAFLRWLGARNHGGLTIITTNYDVVVETELYKRLGPGLSTTLDLGFDWRDPFTERMIPRPKTPRLRYYKLHGSFNWLRCELCGQVYYNSQEAIAYLSFGERQVWANTCACGASPLRHLIVAPSMVRDIRDPHLLNVWRNATEALRTADEWFIIGYSLPAEDLAIRSMLLRASSARGLNLAPPAWDLRDSKPGPKVTVVQKGSAARPAFRTMFRDLSFLEGGLEELLRRELSVRGRSRARKVRKARS